jgi:hypothetical protein
LVKIYPNQPIIDQFWTKSSWAGFGSNKVKIDKIWITEYFETLLIWKPYYLDDLLVLWTFEWLFLSYLNWMQNQFVARVQLVSSSIHWNLHTKLWFENDEIQIHLLSHEIKFMELESASRTLVSHLHDLYKRCFFSARVHSKKWRNYSRLRVNNS